jgi:hypothetical protein
MIYAMHGVIESPSPEKATDLWMCDTDNFISMLSRRRPFVKLAESLQGNGDALTIDDATCAARDAALLARSYGHEVTLFVNSDYIRDDAPYYLHVLSSLVDQADPSLLATLCCSSAAGKGRMAARTYLKHRLARLPDERDRRTALATLLKKVGLCEVSVPKHLATLSRDQLAALVAAGVCLENHGAGHGHFSVFENFDVLHQMESCKSWLRDNLLVEPQYFAVPFGDVLPHVELSDDLALCWFTLTTALRPGFVGPKVCNRLALELGGDRPSIAPGNSWIEIQ